MKKWIKRIGFSLGVLLGLVFLLILYAANAQGQTGDKTIEELKDQGIEATTFKMPFGDGEINTINTGSENNARILFIHGSPGDWTAWSGFFADSFLQENYFMVSFDRAGFGETTVEAQDSLSAHGEMANAIMDQFSNGDKWIIVSHSYGGAVAAYLFAKYPNKIKGVVFAAPAVSPDHQEPRWYNKIARMKLINWMVGKDFRSSNVEMIGLSGSLRDLESNYEDKKVPHVFIHGAKDILVPYQTVEYWKSFNFVGAEFVLREKMNHFIPWSDPDLILEAIKSFN